MRKDFLISDIETVKKQELEECRIWYKGDSNWLLNYYTEQRMGGLAKEPIFNRNRANYFWAIASGENLKRVHSGLPKAITDTLCYAVGEVHTESKTHGEKLNAILTSNNFNALMQQQVRPLTLALGWGAFKLSIDTKLSHHPIIQFYEADKVKFFAKKGVITAIEFKDDYTYKGKKYILIERREVIDNNATINYKLYEVNEYDKTRCHEVDITTLEETKHLSTNVVKGIGELLAVPVKYFFDIDNTIYGRSIYKGKIDLFDDLDQSLSQRSRTSKLSTPIEYISDLLLRRSKDGVPILPERYDRQYVATTALPKGDGDGKQQITISQPQLNFEQYTNEQFSILNLAISGVISLSTLGYNVSKKDNADAQREKEKTTIMTRNTIIASEADIIKRVLTQALILQELIDGVQPSGNYDISVKYSDFANPTFETKAGVLTSLFSHGAISSEMFVNILYGDTISEESKKKEVAELERLREYDAEITSEFEQPIADRLERKLYNDNISLNNRKEN